MISQALLLVIAIGAVADPARGPVDVGPDAEALRSAARRGLAMVQGAASRYPAHRDCFSCHHQTLPMMAMQAAHDRGLAIDRELFDATAEFTADSFAGKLDDLRAGRNIGGRASTVGYALWALRLAKRPTDDLTASMVEYLLATQEEDGRWRPHGDRPPMEGSSLTTTALAADALNRDAGPAHAGRAASAVRRAREWIEAAPSPTVEDRASKLWGLGRLGADDEALGRAQLSLLGAQRDDGGWAQEPGLDSDAYATGLALVRLRESGLAAGHPAFRRGLRFLLDTQEPDGSWRVATRAKPVQEYFDNGDPHAESQFISTAATCWAVAALCCGLDPADQARLAPALQRRRTLSVIQQPSSFTRESVNS